jgi:hypothetical protein
MPYRIGAKGSFGCSGYPALKEGTNEVMGCHKTRSEAAAQIYAINRSEGNIGKSMNEIKEGDFVTYMGEDDEMMVGRVEYVMTNAGLLGLPGSEYSMEYMEDDKPVIVRKYKEEDGGWKEKPYVSYHRMSQVIKIESLSVSVDLVVEMGSNGSGIPLTADPKTLIEMYNVQVEKLNEKISKSYSSDNEEEDKWDNMEKKCWVGYEQRGMKDKGGRMVPNCVPVGKTYDMDDEMEKAKEPNYGEFIKPRRGGSTPSNPKLYARVVQAAKDKFDVYPSAVANSWVVQEYKRRGGTYKSESQSTTKSIWDGSFNPLRFEK